MSISARRLSRVSRTTPVLDQVFTPAVLPYIATELINPSRGQQYAGVENASWNALNTSTNMFPIMGTIFPDNSANNQAVYGNYPGATQHGFRLSWRTLQPTPTTYNWAPLDNMLNYIGTRRLTLRVFTLNSGGSERSGVSNNFTAMPDWVENIPGATQILTISPDFGTGNYVVPMWDSAAYQNAWTQFLSALGARYDRDERLEAFDASGVGDWSEWHVYSFRNSYSGGADRPWSQTTMNAMIDANAVAFPNTQLLCFTVDPRATWRAMNTPVATAKPIGIRNDSLGEATWSDGIPRLTGSVANQGPQLAIERWKTAPMIFEYYQMWDQQMSATNLRRARQQIQQYHGTGIQSSNVFYTYNAAGWSSTMPASEWDDFSKQMKYIGYRYRISSLTVPQSVSRGGTLTLKPQWVNMGAAPTYDKWTISYALKPAGQPSAIDAASGTSSFDLKTVYYNGNQFQGVGLDPIPSAPVETTDSIVVPAGLTPGNYDIYVKVAWNEHKAGATRTVNYNPMYLAMNNRTSTTGGQYPIGSVQVV